MFYTNKIALAFILSAFSFGLAISQNIKGLDSISAPLDYSNVHVKQLDSDKNTTSFIIWIKKSVKAHKHEKHSEIIYVLEGAGKMRLNEKMVEIKAGDYLFIPEGTIHAVDVTSKLPLKVLSIQTPEFLGDDRIFVD